MMNERLTLAADNLETVEACGIAEHGRPEISGLQK